MQHARFSSNRVLWVFLFFFNASREERHFPLSRHLWLWFVLSTIVFIYNILLLVLAPRHFQAELFFYLVSQFALCALVQINRIQKHASYLFSNLNEHSVILYQFVGREHKWIQGIFGLSHAHACFCLYRNQVLHTTRTQFGTHLRPQTAQSPSRVFVPNTFGEAIPVF
jgi:hypothetical protein